MAHIEIDEKEFEKLLGEKISSEKLEHEASFLGAHWNHEEGDTWDVEVYPNRPDLLSVEGLARAYRGFFNIDKGLPNYTVNEGEINVNVDSSVEEVRPYIGGAVVRELELTEDVIDNLIQLQEKLHQTMGRRRDKLAIGLHDLSELDPDFTYTAVKPDEVSLIPLGKSKEMQLGEILENHEKGRDYSWILEDHEKYPIIKDSEDRVLSFPPIINNQLTEVDSKTSEIFIDVTGKDKQTVHTCLNIIVTALAERGGRIDSVNIEGEQLPDLTSSRIELETEYAKNVSGLDLSKEEIGELLEKMNYGVKYGEEIGVDIPSYRTDVMHQYDIIEDMVIAYGYKNIEPEIPEIDQISEQKPVEKFTDVVRDILVGVGAMETQTYILSNKDKLFGRMEKEEEEIAEMDNALTSDYTTVRNWLMPSQLEVLKQNKHHSYPQKFFEAADVVELDSSSIGARNVRKLVYLESDNSVDFTDAKQVIQVLERDLGLSFEVKTDQKPFFKENRSADLFLNGKKVGFIGEISREVLENWELEKEVTGFELDLEKIQSLK